MKRFPRDFASFVRYYSDLQKHVRTDVPSVQRLSIEEFEMLATELAPGGRVHWQRHAP